MGDSGQAAEIEQLKARIAALEAQVAERDRELAEVRAEATSLGAVLRHLPVGLIAAESSGKIVAISDHAKHLVGDPRRHESPEAMEAQFGIFESDKTTPMLPENTPMAKTIRGEVTRGEEIFVRSQSFPDGAFFEVHTAPFVTPDETTKGGTAIFLDCRQRKFLEEEMVLQNKALAASESDKLETITRLRTAVEQLSTPILEMWEDVLALPVIGIVDSQRSAEMMERLLHEIVQKQSRFVIIDLTGVEVIDTSTADHFMKLVKAVGLIGAQCVLTGIRPAVAQTLVDLDVSFGQLETLRNLRHGLRYCLRVLDGEGV